MKLNELRKLRRESDSKILFLVMDGLGGLPRVDTGKTELETARTPNLDDLARRGICGLHLPVGAGITPGSGPGHLALFGYEPTEYLVGRGVMSAMGIDFDMTEQDVAARGNFCTVDDSGIVTDRRAGRIDTDRNRELCDLLRGIELPGVELFVQTVKEHRFLLVLRGEGLSGDVTDTDPHRTGERPDEPRPLSAEGKRTAGLVKSFIDKARERLQDRHPANMILLRGFSKLPGWPPFPDIFGLRAAALASYPMYRGVTKLLGFTAFHPDEEIGAKIRLMREKWDAFDFFFLHMKYTDSRGEDGDFDAKVEVIERIDRAIPDLLDPGPDVVVVTGDHSTPAVMKAHSWHPVPTLLWSRRCRPDTVERFGERDCMAGGLGPRFPATDLLPLACANAGRLDKYGA